MPILHGPILMKAPSRLMEDSYAPHRFMPLTDLIRAAMLLSGRFAYRTSQGAQYRIKYS